MTENEYHRAVDEAMKPLEAMAESCTPEEVQRLYDDVLAEMEELLRKHGPKDARAQTMFNRREPRGPA